MKTRAALIAVAISSSVLTPVDDSYAQPPADPPEPHERADEQTLLIAAEPVGERTCDHPKSNAARLAGSAVGYWFILNGDWPNRWPSGAILFSPRWSVDGDYGGMHLGPNFGVADPKNGAYLVEPFVFNPYFQFPRGPVRASVGFAFTLLGVDSIRTAGPVFSLLNPRLTAGMNIRTETATFGLEGQYGYMLRLGGIPNIGFAAVLTSVAIHL